MTQSSKILFLGPDNSPLICWIREQGEEVVQSADRVLAESIVGHGFSFLVSYGYRHILRKDVLDIFPDKAINLHISYLPWNRGADPSLWSILDDTPKGVTIHYLDESVDTGDIIVQREVEFDFGDDTLSTSYAKLHASLQDLFRQNWSRIKSGQCRRQKQLGGGSTHRSADKERVSHLLTAGWDTPISALEGYADAQMSRDFWDRYDLEIAQARVSAAPTQP